MLFWPNSFKTIVSNQCSNVNKTPGLAVLIYYIPLSVLHSNCWHLLLLPLLSRLRFPPPSIPLFQCRHPAFRNLGIPYKEPLQIGSLNNRTKLDLLPRRLLVRVSIGRADEQLQRRVGGVGVDNGGIGGDGAEREQRFLGEEDRRLFFCRGRGEESCKLDEELWGIRTALKPKLRGRGRPRGWKAARETPWLLCLWALAGVDVQVGVVILSYPIVIVSCGSYLISTAIN